MAAALRDHPLLRGRLAGLAAAVLFGCSAPLISTLTGAGSALSIAALLYGGDAQALLVGRTVRGTRAESPLSQQDWPALAALSLLGGVVGPLALVLGLLSAVLTIAGAALISEGSLSGTHARGSALIALTTMAWGIDNNIGQRLSLRDPVQIGTVKAAGGRPLGSAVLACP